ncbi:MAG: DUF2141 domain-containing protein [Flavobacteriales bacterium]|nr:DUF2141 domain-containing protein [Flavobacteriales bacterium]
MLSCLIGLSAPDVGVPSTGTLTVNISQLRSDAGQVGILVFNAASGFPGDPGQAVAKAMVSPTGRTCNYAFALGPGRYAVAIMHDENANNELDTNMLGIPTEGYGFSRDASGWFGPPSFDSAAINFSGDAMGITMRMNY